MVVPSRAHFIFGHPLNVPLFLCSPHETFANHGLGRSRGRMELSKEMHLVHMLRLQMSHENTFGKGVCACAGIYSLICLQYADDVWARGGLIGHTFTNIL